MADEAKISGSSIQTLSGSGLDSGKVSSSSIQTLSGSGLDSGKIAATIISTLSTSDVDRAIISGTNIQLLVVGPLTIPSAIPQNFQGKYSQGKNFPYFSGFNIQGKKSKF